MNLILEFVRFSMAVIGCIWGDEAKAKIADFFGQFADVVVRFQGGNNAGHTVFFNGKKYVSHSLPSPLNKHAKLVIASGCVTDLDALKNEIEGFENADIPIWKRLYIYGTVALITELTVRLDQARENYKKKNGKIGTTGKGIGTTYERIAARDAIRFVDIFHEKRLKTKLRILADEVNILLKHYGAEQFSEEHINEIYQNLISKVDLYRPCLVDTNYISGLIEDGNIILYEGAQGALLDPDLGSYPYVTSHSTTVGAILTGCGMGFNKAPKEVVGVYKAYFTRVGSGPLPTKIKNKQIHNKLQIEGNEFGASTGRPRDCAWFDTVLVKRTADENGITMIALTCIDTLCKIGKVKICVGYENIDSMPVLMDSLEQAKPIYVDFDFEGCTMDGVTKWEDVPNKVRQYMSIIEEAIGVPIRVLSFGKEREKTLIR